MLMNSWTLVLAAKLTPILAATPHGATGTTWNAKADGADKFKVSTALDKGADNLAVWGGTILLILGVAAIIVAAYKLVTGLMSHGKKETNWILIIILFVVGALFIFGGWGFVAQTLGAGAQQTVQEWAGEAGTISPLLSI